MMQGFYLLTMQRLKRRRRIAAFACAAALACAGFAVHARLTVPPAIQTAGADLPYVAHSEDGRLLISRGGETLLRTEIDTRTLPAADQTALAQGITLSDAAALARLLEDYGS